MTPSRSVAVIGCGLSGVAVLHELLARGLDVVAVDVDADARRFALNAGASASVRTAQALPVVHGAIIMSPPSTHADILESLLPRRIPILCREPVTNRTATAVSCADIGRERLFVAREWEAHPAVAALADRVRRGELGEILAISLECHGAPDSEDAAWALLPGQLTILAAILDRVPAVVSATCERDGAALRSLQATLAPPSIHLTVHRYPGTKTLALEVTGTLGVASLSSSQGLSDHENLFAGQGFVAAARDFAAFLDGGPAPGSSAAHGLLQVQRVDGIRRMALAQEG